MRRRAEEFYVFFVRQERGGRRERLAVVYCPTQQASAETLVQTLRDKFDTGIAPDRILVVGGSFMRDHLKRLVEDQRVRDNLPPITRYLEPPPIHAAQFDLAGVLTDLDGEEVLSRNQQEAMVHAGLQEVFLSRHAVLDAGHGFHYVKPSKKHSQKFIRTANALISSGEIGFIAFCLLSRVQGIPTNIYTDTATINSVAYALVNLRQSLDPGLAAPAIDSFGSYSGLIEDFVFERESLCLISASTSGGLEDEIAKKYRIAADRVVTLFYCGGPTSSHQVLCNVTKSVSNPDGIEPIESFRNENDCKLCRDHSTRIRIVGDQFLPTDTDYKQVLVTANHAPRWLKDATRQLAFRNAIRAHHHRSSGRDEKRTIYVDLAASMERQSPFAETFDRLMRHAVPASVQRIVHVDDPSSEALATHVADFLYEQSPGRERATLIAARTLSADPNRYKTLEGQKDTILVVAATAVTGRNLQGISQVLRLVHEGKPIVYIVGVVRLRSRRDWQDVKNNISYGRRPEEHPVHAAMEVYLPGDLVGIKSPWDLEVDTLRNLLDQPLAQSNAQLSQFLQNRIATIEKAGSTADRGLMNDLFLPRYYGQNLPVGNDTALKMSRGFVFWPPYDESKATQADVFLTVSAVLHAMRDEHDSRADLKQHEHRRVVLAPGNFSRFNDAPIQASFLRAAFGSELNYRQKEDWSSEMREILKFFFDHPHLEHSAAAGEFLLSLAQKRMQLTIDHTRELLPPLAAETDNQFFKLMATYILERLD